LSALPPEGLPSETEQIKFFCNFILNKEGEVNTPGSSSRHVKVHHIECENSFEEKPIKATREKLKSFLSSVFRTGRIGEENYGTDVATSGDRLSDEIE
jgi:hypothetical protein